MRISKAVILVLATAGCGLFGKKDGDAGTDIPGAIDAAGIVAAPGTPVGKNLAAVARFATEVPMNEPKMIGQTATPKTSPSAGTVVATLKTGTIVTRIATNLNHSLIVFPDPNVPADNLMGWVTDAAFSAAFIPKTTDAGVAVADAGAVVVADAGAVVADAGAAKAQPTCVGGKAVVIPNTTDSYQCRKICTVDADCKKGTKKCEPAKVYRPQGTEPVDIKACHDDKS